MRQASTQQTASSGGVCGKRSAERGCRQPHPVGSFILHPVMCLNGAAVAAAVTPHQKEALPFFPFFASVSPVADIGPEAAAAAAAAAEAAEPELTAKEAKAQAHAEELELVRAGNQTGFKGVYCQSHGRSNNKFRTRSREGVYLGNFSTPEAAALA
jgi:hypothetical protein